MWVSLILRMRASTFQVDWLRARFQRDLAIVKFGISPMTIFSIRHTLSTSPYCDCLERFALRTGAYSESACLLMEFGPFRTLGCGGFPSPGLCFPSGPWARVVRLTCQVLSCRLFLFLESRGGYSYPPVLGSRRALSERPLCFFCADGGSSPAALLRWWFVSGPRCLV